MTFAELVPRLGLLTATFVYCIASGLIPIVNAEVFLVAVAVTAPSSSAAGLVVMATLGQMVAKVILYLAGRGVLRLPLGRRRAALEAVRERFERWRSRDLLVAVSATTGFPPFYAATLVAGALRYSLPRFVVIGSLGRLVRFSLVVAVPQVGRWLAGGAP